MDIMLRKALRKHRELRNQVEGMLLNDVTGEVERQLRNFVAKRPCWIPTTKSGKPSKKQASKSLTFPNAIDWLRVYRELGMEAEFVGALPDLDREEKDDLWWVPGLKGVTPNKLVTCFRKLEVKVYTYTNDLDGSVTKNDRDPANGSYVVRFQRTIEADPEHKNKSAKMLTEEGVKGITLTERLLLELGFFLQTGGHLDKRNITLCSGSRNSDGKVPSMYWHADDCGLCVGWYGPGGRGGGLRARAVVS